MKVLFCVFTYYPNKNGVQTVTQYQAEGLEKLDNDVTVITSNHNINEKSIQIHNKVKIIRIDAYTYNMHDYGNKKEYQELIIEQSKINDIIIFVCCETWSTDWVLPIYDKIQCKKVILFHGMYEFNLSNMRIAPYSIIKKLIGIIRWGIFYKKNLNNIKAFDGFIHLHEMDYSYRYCIQKKINNNYILYNAVEDSFFINDVSKENIVINVGTYCKNKNQLQCLNVFYKSKLDNYKLVLIGQPKNDYYNKLKQYKLKLDKKYGFRNVEIMTDLSREETVKWIKKAKIYLLTSFSEKFPVSLLEGMAAKCPFVSTDVGVVKYLPGGVIGKNNKKIIDGLNFLANEKNYEKYSQEAYDFANKNCRIDTQVKKLENIIKEICKK